MKEYLRVTEVLGYFQEPELVDWKLKVGKKEAKRISTLKAKLGTSVDELIKTYIKEGIEPKLKSDEQKQCWKAWSQWVKDYGVMANSVEVGDRMFDETYRLTGEPDLITPLYIVDIKCTGKIRLKHWLQVGQYARMTGRPYVAILRLDPNLGEYEYQEKKERYEILELQNTFSGLLRAYRYFVTEPMAQKESEHGDTCNNTTYQEVRNKQELV